jgi:dolichol-phosphate mannosyltransferase
VLPADAQARGNDSRTLVILPTYEERDNLSILVPQILALSPDLEVLVVDDNSPDGTGEVADRLAREDSRVSVIHREGKLGLGTAYVAGFRLALEGGSARIVQMDADLSHRPDDLRHMLEVADHADVVIGSRNVAGGRVVGWSLRRKLISKGGSMVSRLLLGLPVRDCTSGFRCLSREALRVVDLSRAWANGYAFQVELIHACHQAGLRVVEIPIVFPDRTRGRSKMSLAIVVEASRLVVELGLRRARNGVRRRLSTRAPRRARDSALP